MVRELDTTHSSLTVLQRVRSQIIEYLELASSFEAQRSYQSRVPIAQVPNEVIVGWEDWVTDPRDPALAEPVFSTNEQEALVQFHHVWADVAAKTPDPLPDLVVLFDHSEWKRLRDAAHEALAVFQVRGQVSEDQELVG